MPHSRSAAKRVRQTEKRTLKNKAAASAMKTHMKRVFAAVAAGDLARAQAELPVAVRRIDKAAKAHAIHRNNASRKKSQVARAVAVLEAKAGAKPKE